MSILSSSKVLLYSDRPRCSSTAERSSNSSPSSLGSSSTAGGVTACVTAAVTWWQRQNLQLCIATLFLCLVCNMFFLMIGRIIDDLLLHVFKQVNEPLTCLVSSLAVGTTGVAAAGFFWFDNRSKRIREPAGTKGETVLVKKWANKAHGVEANWLVYYLSCVRTLICLLCSLGSSSWTGHKVY